MSQPPPKSPTPSKSSLRRTSGVQNPSQRSLVPSPSPRFDENPTAPIRYSPRSPPNQTLDYESEDDEEALIGANEVTGAEDGSLFPNETYNDPSYLNYPFQPFFTLIEDALTSEHHHPSVHYIFADDDTELITEAAIRSLEQDELDASSTTSKAHAQDDIGTDNVPRHEYEPDPEHGQEHHHHRLPLPAPGINEHYLVLDVHPAIIAQQAQTPSQSQIPTQPHAATPSTFGYTVRSFASLSPDWQISSATITSAPTMGDQPSEDEGLMLRVEGRGFAPLDDTNVIERGQRPTTAAGQPAEERDAATRGKEKESLEDMIERFQSRLGEVRKLIEIDQNTFGTDAGAGIGLGVGNPYRDNTASRAGDGATEFTPGSYGLGDEAVVNPGAGESLGGRENYGLEEQD